MTSVYKACYYWPKVTDSKSLKIFTCIRVWVIVIDWKVQNRNKIDPNPNSPRSYLPKSTAFIHAVLFQFYPRAEWIERNFASMKESLLLFGSWAQKKKRGVGLFGTLSTLHPTGEFHLHYDSPQFSFPLSIFFTSSFAVSVVVWLFFGADEHQAGFGTEVEHANQLFQQNLYCRSTATVPPPSERTKSNAIIEAAKVRKIVWVPLDLLCGLAFFQSYYRE